MKLINKFIVTLEKKFGKYAISNLPLYMIALYAIGYVMIMINPTIISFITFDPYKIIHNFQIWRLVSWLVIPPDGGSISVFIIITLLFYYSISKSLERAWGEFYFNYYIFSGLIFTVIFAFVLYGILACFVGSGYTLELYSTVLGNYVSTYYVCMSLFLAYAATFPDARILIYFVIPVKVKTLGYIYAGFLLYNVLSIWAVYHNLIVTGVQFTMLVASMLNFIIFYLATKKATTRTTAQKKFAKQFNQKMKTVEHAGISKHKCCICGRTGESNPELEFRFCSKCEGNYEYCNDHIFTHKHKDNGSVYY